MTKTETLFHVLSPSKNIAETQQNFLDQDTKSLSSQTHFSNKVGQSQPEDTDSPFKLLPEFCVQTV